MSTKVDVRSQTNEVAEEISVAEHWVRTGDTTFSLICLNILYNANKHFWLSFTLPQHVPLLACKRMSLF